MCPGGADTKGPAPHTEIQRHGTTDVQPEPACALDREHKACPTDEAFGSEVSSLAGIEHSCCTVVRRVSR